MSNTYVCEREWFVTLHMDEKTGVAWIEDGRSGNGHSAHANIDKSGSVEGMISAGYWNKDDKIADGPGYLYNISHTTVHDKPDFIAMMYCNCGEDHVVSRYDLEKLTNRGGMFTVRDVVKILLEEFRMIAYETGYNSGSIEHTNKPTHQWRPQNNRAIRCRNTFERHMLKLFSQLIDHNEIPLQVTI